jgi:glutathione peroxidase-family protein
MSSIYDLTMNSITGDAVELSRYRDEALLIVNLASQ